MNEVLEDLFSIAIELPPAEREPYLRRYNPGHPSLVREVLELVSDGEKAEALLGGAVTRLAASLDLDPGTPIGPYIIREKIGEGGMGVVYLADRADGQFEQRVAIKLVRGGPGITSRFLRERRILAQLSHPGIARLIDGGLTAEGHPYMVMEFCDGQPISHHCRNLRLRETLQLFRSICDAVEYAHRNLIVHRDLKPANILVNAEGEIKLLDFGIAKLLDRSVEGASTHAGQHLFTPDYASPEQIRGDAVTTATDVYSLGAVLFELLAGKSPHQLTSYTPHEMTEVICQRPAPALRLGNELDHIVAMALRKEPERRYPSVAALAEDIDRFLGDHPVMARGDGTLYRAAKFLRRHAVAASAGSLAVLCLSAGLGVAAWQARIANHRFEEVRKLARTVLFDFDEQIRNVAGTTNARELLTRTAVAYLDSLANEASADTNLRQELAAGYEKVGDVQGEPARPNLGQRQNAVANYRKALDLWKSLPEDPVAVARLLLKLQTILGAKPLLDEGCQAARKAWQQQPFREDAMAVLLQSQLNTGQYFHNRSDYNEATRHYREAEASALDWARRWPGKRAELAWIGVELRLGDLALSQGEPQVALAAFDRAQSRNDKLSSDVDQLRRAFKLRFLRGHALGNPEYIHLGRIAEAADEYRAAMALSKRLLEVDPTNALARGDYADAAWALAVTVEASDPKQAKALLEESVREAKAVSAKSPTTLSFIHNSANSQYALAKVLRALGEHRLALEYTSEAIRLHRSIVEARPKQLGLRHNLMPPMALFVQLQLDRGCVECAQQIGKELRMIAATVDTKAANFRGKAQDLALAEAADARLKSLAR